MKETFYFQHDYEPTSDPKMSAFVGTHGGLGYGIYWRIIEMMHSSNSHKLEFKEYLLISLSKQMLTDVQHVESIIHDCINVFELFIYEDGLFWSDRVFRNIELRTKISEQRSKAGRASAEKRKQLLNNISTTVQRPLTSVEQIPTKEIKEKEIKVNKRKEFIAPSLQEVIEYFLENGYSEESARKAYKYYDEAYWYDSKGNRVKNWKQRMIGVWFKDENRIKQSRMEEIKSW